MVKLGKFLLLLTLLMFLVSGARATVMFSFSFDDNLGGGTAGPISGTVAVPDVCASCVPTAVTLKSVDGHPTYGNLLPYDLLLYGWMDTGSNLSITPSGLIGFLHVTHQTSPYFGDLRLTEGNPDFASLQTIGSGGVQYTAYRSGLFEELFVAVPTPSVITLLLLGLLAMWLTRSWDTI